MLLLMMIMVGVVLEWIMRQWSQCGVLPRGIVLNLMVGMMVIGIAAIAHQISGRNDYVSISIDVFLLLLLLLLLMMLLLLLNDELRFTVGHVYPGHHQRQHRTASLVTAGVTHQDLT